MVDEISPYEGFSREPDLYMAEGGKGFIGFTLRIGRCGNGSSLNRTKLKARTTAEI